MKYDLFIAASTYGFQAFKNKACDVSPLVAALFHLAPDVRFQAKNILPLMFVPNDTQPKDLQSFLIPFVNEILSTYRDGGVQARLPNGDAIRFKIHLIWFSAYLAALLYIYIFLNQSILFIVSAMPTAGKRSNTISAWIALL